MKDPSECSEPEKRQVEHGRSYTRIENGPRRKLLILRPVRVLARDSAGVRFRIQKRA
jgi:hypothetical protein